MDLFFENSLQAPVNAVQAEFILSQSFPFYQKLNYDNKKKFTGRLQHFVQQKKFVPRQDLVITDEMRVLISACAIQLTFGLDNYTIDYFEYILVYPDIYQSTHTIYTHHGEVNLAGFICFSWKSVKMGIEKVDNFNVGLHEWSHALRFNGINDNPTDTFFKEYFAKWFAGCEKLYYNIRTGRDKYINKYGGSNAGEFFPVLIEHFFENPEKFKTNYPGEYKQTCILLNHDPLNPSDPGRGQREKLFLEDNFPENNPVLIQGGTPPVNVTRVTVMLFIVSVISVTLLAVIDTAFPNTEAAHFICPGSILALIAVPIVMIASPFAEKTLLTTAGLLYPANTKNQKQYSWDKILQVSFLDGSGNFPDDEQYGSFYFRVIDGTDFKTIKLYSSLDEKKANEFEKFFREKTVGIIRKRIR